MRLPFVWVLISLSVSSVFLLPAHVNMVGTKSSSSPMQVTSGYEVFDSRKELEAKGEHENSIAEMSLPQDVTWTDHGTGLMWTKEDNGSRINWNEANQYCRDMKVKNFLGALSNSGPAVRLYSEGRAPEDRYRRGDKLACKRQNSSRIEYRSKQPIAALLPGCVVWRNAGY
jgi:hypothetical protein